MTEVAGMDMAEGAGRPRWAVPQARCYNLTDRITGEDYEADAGAIERLIGIEVGYIDWVITTDGAFENARWRVTVWGGVTPATGPHIRGNPSP